MPLEPDTGHDKPEGLLHGDPKKKGDPKQRRLAYAAVAVGLVGTTLAWLTFRGKGASTTKPATGTTGGSGGTVAGGTATDAQQQLASLVSQQGEIAAQSQAAQAGFFAGLSDQLAGLGSQLGAQLASVGTITQPATDTGLQIGDLSNAIAGLVSTVAAIPWQNAASGASIGDTTFGGGGTQVGAQPPPGPVQPSNPWGLPDNWQQLASVPAAPTGYSAVPIVHNGQIIGENLNNDSVATMPLAEWQTQLGLAPALVGQQAVPIVDSAGVAYGERFVGTPTQPQPDPAAGPERYTIYGRITQAQYDIAPPSIRL